MSEHSEKIAGMAIYGVARDIDGLKAEIERLREERAEIYAKYQLERGELLTEIERLRGELDAAALEVSRLERLVWTPMDAYAEIERLRGELDRTERIASLTVAASSVAGEALRKMDEANAEIERLRQELAEKDDYIKTVSRPVGAHSYE